MGFLPGQARGYGTCRNGSETGCNRHTSRRAYCRYIPSSWTHSHACMLARNLSSECSLASEQHVQRASKTPARMLTHIPTQNTHISCSAWAGGARSTRRSTERVRALLDAALVPFSMPLKAAVSNQNSIPQGILICIPHVTYKVAEC